MGGKSTYLRQTALLVIMAHMGAYVPAESAEVPLTDRVFTRIGAGDNLAGGASTFLVEMREVANILHNASAREPHHPGRGGPRHQHLRRRGRGLGGAGAPAPFRGERRAQDPLRHPLLRVDLAARADVRRQERPRGRAGMDAPRRTAGGGLPPPDPASAPPERSFGIHVAQMAGLPVPCVDRAKEVLKDLEKNTGPRAPAGTVKPAPQMELFKHPVLKELEGLDLDRLTPLEALQILHRLAAAAKKSLW